MQGTMNASTYLPKPSLQEMCVQVCVKYLDLLPPLHTYPKRLSEVHKYLAVASPLVQIIARKSRYYFSGAKTLIFIPFLLRRGDLIITDENIVEASLWIDSHSTMEHRNIIGLEKLIITASRAENYFRIVPFISKMPNITKLVLNTGTTDDVLAAVGVYCNKLELFDARCDTETSITDIGLGFLSQCKTLKMILLSDIADEYDYEDKFMFTGKGIALLMLSLKQLERIECPEYLLRDALHYIYQMNFQNPVLPLKCLFLAYPDVPAKTISILPYLCPHLETLSVYIRSGETGIFSNAVKQLLSLKKLKLKFEVSCNFESFAAFNYPSQIEYLIIDTQVLHESDLYKLNLIFPHLRTLVLKVHSFGFVPSSNSFCHTGSDVSLFHHLHYVQFDQRISGKLFRLINLSVKNLKGLYCQKAVIYDIENSLECIICNGGWQALEVLVFPNSSLFSCNFLYENVKKLTRLKFVAVRFTHIEEEVLFRGLVDKAQQFQLCKAESLPMPSNEFCAL